MTAFTPLNSVSQKWGLPFINIADSTLLPYEQWNIAIRMIDAFAYRHVESFTTTAPPASPNDGDLYFCPIGSSGAWLGKDGFLAVWLTSYNAAGDDGWWFTNEPLNVGRVLYDGANLKFAVVVSINEFADFIDDADVRTFVDFDNTVITGTTRADIEPMQLKLAELADALSDIGIITRV